MFWSKKRNDIDELFSKFVRPELVEAMKSPDFKPPLNELRSEKINYLLVAVDGPTPNDIGKNLGVVADVAKECGWYGDFLFSNLAVLIDGVALPKGPPPHSRQELRAKVIALLGSQCKSVGGEEAAPWGDYGSARRRVFGAMLPDFLEVISQLHHQSFGGHADRDMR